VLYADRNMDSMRAAIAETERRRAKQETYYAEHGITPETIIKNVDEVLGSIFERDYLAAPSLESEEEELSLA
jgi:excinuclease ABC subunit B